jgi:hypothetical protein
MKNRLGRCLKLKVIKPVNKNGATTLSIKTFSIMVFSIAINET